MIIIITGSISYLIRLHSSFVYACVHVCMYTTLVCVCVCACACICICTYTCESTLHVHPQVNVCVCLLIIWPLHVWVGGWVGMSVQT